MNVSSVLDASVSDVTSVVRVATHRTAVLRASRHLRLLSDTPGATTTSEWRSDVPISALFALDAPGAPKSVLAAWSGATRRLQVLSVADELQVRSIAAVNVQFDDVDVDDDDDDSTTLIRAHAATATLALLRTRASQLTVVRVDFSTNQVHFASHALQFAGTVLDWNWFDDDFASSATTTTSTTTTLQWTIGIASGSLAAPHFDMCRVSMRRDSLSLVAANFPQTLPKRTSLVVPIGPELAFCGLGSILFLSLQRQAGSTAVALAQRSIALPAVDGAAVALCSAGASACFLVTRRGTLYHVDSQRGIDRVTCVAAAARVADAGAVHTLLHCRGDAKQHQLVSVTSLGVLSFINVTVGASSLSTEIQSSPAPRLRRALAVCPSESDDSLLVATPDGLSTLMRGVSVQPATPIVQFAVDEAVSAPVRAAFAVSMSASLVAESDSIIVLSLPLPPRRVLQSSLTLSSSTATFAKKGKRKSRADDDDDDDLDSDDSVAPTDDFADVVDDEAFRAPSARKRTVTKRFRDALGVAADDEAGGATSDVVDEPEAVEPVDDEFNADDAASASKLRKSGGKSSKKKTDSSTVPVPGQDGVTRLFEMLPDGQWDERPLRELGKRATLCAGRLVGSFIALVSATDVRIVEMASYAPFFKWSSTSRIVSADVSLTDIVVLEETGDVRLLRMTPITMKMADERTIMSWQVVNLPHAVTEAALVALAPAQIACTCSMMATDQLTPCNAHDNADVVYAAYRAHLSPLVVAASADSLRLFHVDKGVSDVFELPLREAGDESLDPPTSLLCTSRRPLADGSRAIEVLIAFASGLIRSFRLEDDGNSWNVVAQNRTLVSSGALVLQRTRNLERPDLWSAYVFGTSAGPIVRLQVGQNVAMQTIALHGTTAVNGRCLWQMRRDALLCVGATTAAIVTLPFGTAPQSFEAVSWCGVDAGTERLPISHLLALSPTSRLAVLQSNRTAPMLRFANAFGTWSAQVANVPFVASESVVAAIVDTARALVVLAARNDADGTSSLRVMRVDGDQVANIAIDARVSSLALLDGVGVVVGAERSVRVYEWASGGVALHAITSLDIAGAAVSVSALASHGAIAAWDDSVGPILLQYKDRALRLRASCKRTDRCSNRAGVVAIGEHGANSVRIVSGDATQWLRLFECDVGEAAPLDEVGVAEAMILAALTQLATSARRREELECVGLMRVDGNVRSVTMQGGRGALAVDTSGQLWRIECRRVTE